MDKKTYRNIVKYLNGLVDGTVYDGHVFVCGGAVRDEIMDNPIKDIDMCVTLPNGGIDFANFLYDKSVLKYEPVVYPTYGTAMFILTEFPDIEIEVVQTRKEQYKDINSRNPEVVFGTLGEDCKRRDLTINSMYYDISNEKYLDLTGLGISDIENHVIRTTNDPDVIFSDDPLRIMRCIRFSCRYGWNIEDTTMNGMKKNAERLSIITKERVQDEFNKMLLSKNPIQALEKLMEINVMKFISPELEEAYRMEQNKYHIGTVWEHSMKVLANVSLVSESLVLRMAALLHDIGKIKVKTIDEKGNIHFYQHETKTDIVRMILKSLKYPNEFIKDVIFLTKNHMRTKHWGDDCKNMRIRSLRKLQFECGKKYFDDLMILIDADNNAHAEGYCLPNQVPNILKASHNLEVEESDMFDYHLPINGNDVMEVRKIKPGEEVKRCLEYSIKLAYNNPKMSKELFLKHIKSYRIPIKKMKKYCN